MITNKKITRLSELCFHHEEADNLIEVIVKVLFLKEGKRFSEERYCCQLLNLLEKKILRERFCSLK